MCAAFTHLRIGDFEGGAHKCVSRLELLVSPSSGPPGGCASKKKNCDESSKENTDMFLYSPTK